MCGDWLRLILSYLAAELLARKVASLGPVLGVSVA